MNDEIKVPVSLPLDNDHFLRRECPNCEQQFKWFSHEEGSEDAERVSQYFCPLCGVAADLDQWWTPQQLEYARGLAGPAMDQIVNDMLDGALKPLHDSKFIRVKPTRDFSFDIPAPEPLIEPNDMVIVESPCHPHEPVKVPEIHTWQVFCLVCGSKFAA